MRYLLLILSILMLGSTSAQVQYLGSPTTTVRNRGNFVSDSLFYLPKRTKAPSDTAALRYQISDSTVYVWTGSQWRAVSVSGLYVPYTGAISDVDLGTFSLNAKSLHIKGTGGQGHLGLKHQNAVPSLSASESGLYANVTGDLAWQNDNLYSSTFKTSNQTASRIYTFQNKSYTLADSADVAARMTLSDTATMLNPYVRGSGTVTYIPKFTTTRTIGNSLMYDSSSHVRAYGNWIGNNNSSRFLFQTEVDGQNGYGLKVQQNDSNDNNIQYVTTFRHGLVTSAKPRPEFGVGHDMSVQDDAGTFRRVGTILTRLTDTTAAGISAKMQFGVAKSGSIVTPLQIYSDSSVRMAKLAGSGSRYVVADANGDLTATSATTSTIGGSGTTNYIPKFTASGTIGNSVAYDNGGTELLVGTTSDAGAYALQVAGSIYNTTGAAFATSSGNVAIGTTSNIGKFDVRAANDFNFSVGQSGVALNLWATNNGNTAYVPLRIDASELRINTFSAGNVGIGTTSPSYKLDITGDLRTTTGAVFASSSGNVGIGTTSPQTKLDVLGKIQIGEGGSLPFAGVSAVNLYKASNPRISFYDDVAHEASIGVVTVGGTTFGSFTFNVGASTPERMRITSDGELLINTTTDAGDYKLQVAGNIYGTGSITTGAPSGGTAKPFKIGAAASVSPTSPNRTIEIEIDGTTYYLHAKTTND